MTAEQLQSARLRVWHQAGTPLLTAEDAAAWLREAGLVPFSPLLAQTGTLPSSQGAPAGSFLEATLGRPEQAPSLTATEAATHLLHRLLGSSDAVALKLDGAPGDRPDLLATPEVLPFLLALRGDRDWQKGPRGKSSPLVVEVWKLLGEGALSAGAVKDALGRQLTESAALRALTELWSTLRVEPVYASSGRTETREGAETRWQRIEVNHARALLAASTVSQATALSALVSLYLQFAVAATGDEIDAFLLPLASRSRIREAVRGLLATRQLSVRSLGPQEHYYVEGSLPEFEPIATRGGLPAFELRAPISAPTPMKAGSQPAPVAAAATQPGEAASRIPDPMPGEAPDALPEEVSSPVAFQVPQLQPDPQTHAAPAVRSADKAAPPTAPVEPATEVPGLFRIEALTEQETERERTVGEGRKRFVAQRSQQTTDRKEYGKRPAAFGSRPGSFPKPGFGSSSKPSFRPSADRPYAPRGSAGDGIRKPTGQPETGKPGFSRPGSGKSAFRKPGPNTSGPNTSGSGNSGADRPFFAREPWKEDRAPQAPGLTRGTDRPQASGAAPRPPYEAGQRGSGQSAPGPDQRPAAAGPRKPFAPRTGSSASPFGGKSGYRPDSRNSFRPASGSRFTGKPPRSGGSADGAAPRGDRRPFAPRPASDPAAGADARPAWKPREGSAAPPRATGKWSPSEAGPGKTNFGAGGMRPPRKPFASPRGAPGGGFGPARDNQDRDRNDRRPIAPQASGKPPAAWQNRPGGPSGPAREPRERSRPASDRPASRNDRDQHGDTPDGSSGQYARQAGPAGSYGSKPGYRPAGTYAPKSGKPRPGSSPADSRGGGARAKSAGFGAKRPRTSAFTSTGKPRAGVTPIGRPGARASRPASQAGASARPADLPGTGPRSDQRSGPGGYPARKPGFGARKAGPASRSPSRPGKPAFGARKPGFGPRKPIGARPGKPGFGAGKPRFSSKPGSKPAQDHE